MLCPALCWGWKRSSLALCTNPREGSKSLSDVPSKGRAALHWGAVAASENAFPIEKQQTITKPLAKRQNVQLAKRSKKDDRQMQHGNAGRWCGNHGKYLGILFFILRNRHFKQAQHHGLVRRIFTQWVSANFPVFWSNQTKSYRLSAMGNIHFLSSFILMTNAYVLLAAMILWQISLVLWSAK